MQEALSRVTEGLRMIHRPIDFIRDRDYVLERHCRVNYACESAWARERPYEDYRAEWFGLSGQIEAFYGYLEQTAREGRAIAEIIEAEDGQPIGYLWATFSEDAESGFSCAEVQEIYVEEAFRRRGAATGLYEYVEERARQRGAKVIRAGTGRENSASIRFHEKNGYVPYRYEFEKLLCVTPP